MKFDFNKRPLSWSAISCFKYNPEEWYEKYVLGRKPPASKEMIFGSAIGKKLETDPTFLPEVVRHSYMEYPFSVKFSGIKMVGYADSFCDKTFTKLAEYKTGKKEWDQKRVDTHGQIDMYLLMNYITNKVRPENVEVDLYWLPTIEDDEFAIKFADPFKVECFRTKRTMSDILKFGKEIKDIVEKMQRYADNHE